MPTPLKDLFDAITAGIPQMEKAISNGDFDYSAKIYYNGGKDPISALDYAKSLNNHDDVVDAFQNALGSRLLSAISLDDADKTKAAKVINLCNAAKAKIFDINKIYSHEGKTYTPLGFAATKADIQSINKISYLAEADINGLDDKGLSPLRYAALHDHTTTASLLKKPGIKFTKGPDGKTELEAAIASNQHDKQTINILKEFSETQDHFTTIKPAPTIYDVVKLSGGTDNIKQGSSPEQNPPQIKPTSTPVPADPPPQAEVPPTSPTVPANPYNNTQPVLLSTPQQPTPLDGSAFKFMPETLPETVPVANPTTVKNPTPAAVTPPVLDSAPAAIIAPAPLTAAPDKKPTALKKEKLAAHHAPAHHKSTAPHHEPEIRRAIAVQHSALGKIAETLKHALTGTLGQHETKPEAHHATTHIISEKLRHKLDGVHLVEGHNAPKAPHARDFKEIHTLESSSGK